MANKCFDTLVKKAPDDFIIINGWIHSEDVPEYSKHKQSEFGRCKAMLISKKDNMHALL